MSHIHTLTFISLLDTHFCVLVALPVHSLPVLLCLPDLLSVGNQVMHGVSFHFRLLQTIYHFLTEGWAGSYLLIRCSKCLLLLAYRGVLLLSISNLARQPFH